VLQEYDSNQLHESHAEKKKKRRRKRRKGKKSKKKIDEEHLPNGKNLEK